MTVPQLSIIIPVCNQWPLTEQCLQSLREHTPGNSFEVIVVDNGSTDETPLLCPELGHGLFGLRFEHVRLESNINFGPGCNLGASRASGSLFFFLNNDTLLTAGWLEPLLEAFVSEQRLGAAGPVLLYPGSNRVQHLGLAFTPTNHVAHVYHFFPGDHPVVGRKRFLQAITGAALMIPKDVFEQAGRFWEEYRNGYEDLDLCSRIRALGAIATCIPASRFYHLANQTPGRFDAEGHNSQVLARRCHHAFQPDMHLLAAADGYHLHLTPLLTPNFVYVSNDLESKPFDLKETWAAVLAEPFLKAGYERLLEYFFEQENWVAALDLLQLQQCFFSSEKLVADMAKAAEGLGDTVLLLKCRTTLESLRSKARSPAVLDAFKAMLQTAKDAQDALLVKACHDWQAAYAPSASHSGD